MILIIYIITMVTMPFLADLFLKAKEDGGLFAWYDKYVLFPLRERNSKWGLALGDCEQCFTIWLTTLSGTAITAYWLYTLHTWVIWIFPTYMFLNLGLSSMIYKLFKQLK